MDARTPHDSAADVAKAVTREIQTSRGYGTVTRESSPSSSRSSKAASARWTPPASPKANPHVWDESLEEPEPAEFQLMVDGEEEYLVGRPRADSIPRVLSDSDLMLPPQKLAALTEPGGFRRQFLHDKAEVEGTPFDERPLAWRQSFIETVRPLIRSGYYDSILSLPPDPEIGAQLRPSHSQVGLTQAALALLKGFIGSGILFLPGAFANGGWLFSVITLMCISGLNFVSILNVVTCCEQTGCASYDALAKKAGGRLLEVAVRVSLLLCQFGCCTMYIVFISTILRSLGMAKVTAVLVQLPIIAPLCLIRSVHSLEYPNLLADVLIVFGLIVVLVYGAQELLALRLPLSEVQFVVEDSHRHMVQPFQPATCVLMVGATVFAFEGIPTILPIRNSMVCPEKFRGIFFVVFIGVTIAYVLFGLLGYVAFSRSTEGVQSLALLNLPDTALAVSAMACYMVALLFSLPLQFMPGIRVAELWCFGSRKHAIKEKNALRLAIIFCLACLAVLFADNFDVFLAFIGTFCTLPVMLIYPSLFHLALVAEDCVSQAIDVGIALLGVAGMAVTLFYT